MGAADDSLPPSGSAGEAEAPSGSDQKVGRSPLSAAELARGREAGWARQAEIRERRAAGETSRYQQYLAGTLKVQDMDDEEVGRGQFKDLAGGWLGSNAQRFTAKQSADIKRELLRRGQAKLEDAYLMAIGVLTEVATSGAAADKDRLKAAMLLMERVAGKVPDRVEVGGADAFADVLQGIIDESVVERREGTADAE